MRDPIAMTAPLDFVPDLEGLFGQAPPAEIVAAAVRDLFPGQIAVVSSFGADSAVLLQLVAAVDPATPGLFIDTRPHLAETPTYPDPPAPPLAPADLPRIR